MSILSAFRSKLYEMPKAITEPEPEKAPPLGEIGYADSILYSTSDFPKYNPDGLIGRKGTGIYRQMMLDDQVKAVLRFKQYAVISRSYYFDVDVDEDGNESEEHKTQADFYNAMIQNMDGNFSDKLIEILSAMINGYSISEKIYSPFMYDGKPYWGIKDIKLRPYETFNGGIITDEHGNVVKISQVSGTKKVELPLNKVIYYVYQPDKDRIFGESDLRACYRNYWSKDIIIKFQNIHLERHAGGFIYATIEGGLDPTEMKNLENLLSNITAKTSARIPKGVDLKQMMPINTDSFEKAIAQHDKAIAKSVLVPNLLGITEQGTTGSYAQSQTQIDAFFWVLEQIANSLAETLNEQIFRDLAKWNFGTEDFPPFRFEEISQDQKSKIALMWSDLISKGAVTKSDTDESYIRKLVGFPQKAEDEEEPKQSEVMPGDEMPDDGSIFPQEPDNTEWINEQAPEKKQNILKLFASKPWLKRIDYAQTKRELDYFDDKLGRAVADIMAKVKTYILKRVAQIVGDKTMGSLNPKDITDISIPGALQKELRQTLRNSFTAVLNKSYRQAQKELPKKRNDALTGVMDKVQAEKFLSSRAMKITDVLNQRVLSDVQTVLENGIRYDKALREVMRDIETNTDLISYLPKLDAAGRAVNVPARIQNIVRTNDAYAWNEARDAFFHSPENRGFVVAYEYSAILDDVTTEICEELNGLIQEEWGAYAPPNHFQCRSVLIPVTAIDDWNGKSDTIPNDVAPQKGFM